MASKPEWKKELEFLRNIIDQNELVKTKKWGGEVYTLNNGNVLSIAPFKNYVSLWFFNGVFLSDPYNVLGNSQEGKTKALRHWHFTSLEQMEKSKITEYIQEAIENEKKGLKWKPEKSEELVLPELLSSAIQKDSLLEKAFAALTPFKQKEYAEYIEMAKREQTKLDRLSKIRPMIMAGKGLNDKYR